MLIKSYKRCLALTLLLIMAALMLSACSSTKAPPEPTPTPDPHEGQVYLYDGFDWIWMTPLEGVPANDLTEQDFKYLDGVPTYTGSDYIVTKGVDVSEHQHDVDWQKVAAAGIDFAFIRMGYRGCTEGGLFEDPWYRQNITGALDAGLDVGVYFFSQAISVEEAREEARFVLEAVAPYSITMPIVFDWEKIESADGSSARTDDMNFAVLTDAAEAFCEEIRGAGYTPCIYFNRHIGYYGINLSRVTDCVFWFALPESVFPNFYYAVDIWQCSFTETIPGIEGETDLNLMFTRKAGQATATAP